MRGLIGDLLDTRRIESGTLSVAPEPSEVADLVERARTTFVSGGGRHPVLVDLPAGLPPVMADRRRIVQVLNNLFANAGRLQVLDRRMHLGRVPGNPDTPFRRPRALCDRHVVRAVPVAQGQEPHRRVGRRERVVLTDVYHCVRSAARERLSSGRDRRPGSPIANAFRPSAGENQKQTHAAGRAAARCAALTMPVAQRGRVPVRVALTVNRRGLASGLAGR